MRHHQALEIRFKAEGRADDNPDTCASGWRSIAEQTAPVADFATCSGSVDRDRRRRRDRRDRSRACSPRWARAQPDARPASLHDGVAKRWRRTARSVCCSARGPQDMPYAPRGLIAGVLLIGALLCNWRSTCAGAIPRPRCARRQHRHAGGTRRPCPALLRLARQAGAFRADGAGTGGERLAVRVVAGAAGRCGSVCR